jgi:hypothetical protein
MLYVERIQQLIMQHPHHRSLGSLVTTGQPPGTSTRGSFYGTQNIFHIGALATSWPARVCHKGPHATCFCRRRRSWELNVLRCGCRRCGYLSAYRRAAAALLRSASPYSNIISVNSSNEYSALCAILQYVTCLPQGTPQHQNINSSDLIRVCRLNDCFIRFVALPRSCHISLTKRLRLYVYMNISACL